MRFSRLVLEAGSGTVSLTLDPRLTIVAGVDAPVRAMLADELIGGLAGDRSGVHLEMAEDAGRLWKVLRPGDRPHRVVDSETGVDLTDEFSTPDGRVDVLDAHGLDAGRARALLFVDRAALEHAPEIDERLAHLAAVNQAELWSLAARVRVTDDEVRSLQMAAETRSEHHDAVARIEKRHQSLETAVLQDQQVQQNAMRVALFALLAAIVAGLAGSSTMYLLLGLAGLISAVAAAYRLRVNRAVRSERAALADAGSASYLGFVVKQVDGMMTGTEHRKRLMAAAEDHRSAAIAWTQRVGDIGVEWALAHQQEIGEASRLEHELSLLQDRSDNMWIDDHTVRVSRALVAHVIRLRHAGRAGESLPMLLDDPFEGLDAQAKAVLLDLLARAGGTPQIVLLTDDPEVSEWTRRRGTGAGVTLVEPLGASDAPTPEPGPEPTAIASTHAVG